MGRKVSIIMPAYNAEKTIEQAIDSVAGQTFLDWELLVMDDCSTDGTGRTALRYAARDERIRYIRNDRNLGVAESRNKGVLLASGQWIAFLDSDDVWETDKLELQMKLADETGARFVFTGSSFMNQNGDRLKYCLRVRRQVDFRELLKQNIISCSSVVIEKKLLIKYPMAQGNLHEDYAVWLKILRSEKMTAYGIDRPLLIYRVSPGSKSGNKGRAAVMHWNVYRHIHLPLVLSVYYFSVYAIRNLCKYTRIWLSNLLFSGVSVKQ